MFDRVVLLALLAGSLAADSVVPVVPVVPVVDIEQGVKIPLRDGVQLNATIYRPHGQTEPLPVVAFLTPYMADGGHPQAADLAHHGYAAALVDVRGRGGSGGDFEPMAHEARDGYDLVEWLARQPWSNGKITMRGASYAGYVQWAALKEKPPHLATIVPTASPYPGIDYPFYKNIFFVYGAQWLSLTSGANNNSKLFGDQNLWIGRLRELYQTHRPYRDFETVAGDHGDVFRKWLQHPLPDAYWNAMVPTPGQYAAMDVPILSISGYYDGDQPGALAFYGRHQRWASQEARRKHFLVLGPWDHAGTANPAREIGGLTFGAASAIDMPKLHRDWYDWILKNGPRPAFLEKRVAFYMPGPGAEDWRYADSLEEIEKSRRTLFLTSDSGKANDVFASGRLTEQLHAAPPDHFVDDPLDVHPAERESQPSATPYTDQSLVLDLGETGLVYHSEPFPGGTEIAGQVKLSLWISLDVPDADLLAGLFELRPDGSSILLASDMLRARYRHSLEREELIKPGNVERYDFDRFAWFARRLEKGSRLRLVVTALNSLFFEKNYHAGGVVADESGKDARTAHVTVWHDAEHPSALTVPMGE